MSDIEPKIIEHIKKVLTTFDDKYMDNEKIKRNILINDLDKYDADLMAALLSDSLIRDTYTEKIADVEIFKVNQFIEMLEYKDYLEDSYTKFKNKIGLTAGGKFIDESSDVVLDFPFKDCVLKASMSREDMDDIDEVFLNEVIAKSEIDELFNPKILVNTKKFDKEGEHEVTEFRDDDNLVIKGNNLIALHSIKKRYAGKVKLIFIDPPYNTGNDSFKYNDRFNHSSWLTFMKNRLEIARDLLSEDGSILVSIDEKEEAYLKILMDNIFGKYNFVQNFHIQVRYNNKSLNEKNDFQPIMEYILAYSKNKSAIKPNKPKIPYDMSKFNLSIKELSSPDKIFTVSNRTVEVFYPTSFEIKKVNNCNIDFSLFKETWITGSIYSGTGHGQVYQKVVEPRRDEDGLGCLYKIYGLGEDGLGFRYMTGPQKINAKYGKMYTQVPIDKRKGILDGTFSKELPIINYYDFSSSYGNIRHEGGIPFNGGKKPEKMLKMFIEMFTNENDIVLDFHLGSGSTISTAHKLKRRYVGIEQMDYIQDIVQRLNNVIQSEQTGISKDVNWQGGDSFVYAELMEKNHGYLKEVMQAQNQEQLMIIFNRMKEFGDLDFRIDLEKFAEEKSQLSLDEQKEMLIKIIDKNQLYYNYSEIDDEDVRDLLLDNDYQFNKSFYGGAK